MDYSRFTPKARSCIQKAYSISQSCCYVEVSPSVLMVSMIQEAKDIVFFLLQQMGVDKMAFCQSISEKVSQQRQNEGANPEISTDLNKILNTAIRLASESNAALTGVEHIFWAFTKEQCELSDVYHSYGMSEDRIVQSVITFRNGHIANSTTEGTEASEPSALSKYARNMNVLASTGVIEPTIGRDEEVRNDVIAFGDVIAQDVSSFGQLFVLLLGFALVKEKVEIPLDDVSGIGKLFVQSFFPDGGVAFVVF